MSEDTTDVGAAITGELQLLDPDVRVSRSLAERLLDPEFIEVGASGRRWTYEEMIAALPEMSGADTEGPRHEPSGMTGVVLAPGLVHLTYESVLGGSRARRSSLWRRKPGETEWRCTTTRRRRSRWVKGRISPDRHGFHGPRACGGPPAAAAPVRSTSR